MTRGARLRSSQKNKSVVCFAPGPVLRVPSAREFIALSLAAGELTLDNGDEGDGQSRSRPAIPRPHGLSPVPPPFEAGTRGIQGRPGTTKARILPCNVPGTPSLSGEKNNCGTGQYSYSKARRPSLWGALAEIWCGGEKAQKFCFGKLLTSMLCC